MSESIPQKLSKVIKIYDDRIQQHLGELVRGTVEETLNKLLDAEADQLCNAARYERTDARHDTRAGHYKRGLHTKAGEVTGGGPHRLDSLMGRISYKPKAVEKRKRHQAALANG